MNQLSIEILVLHYLMFSHVKAQSPSLGEKEPNSQHASSNFRPSLAAVISLLSIISSLILIILYAFCHQRTSSVENTNQQIQEGLVPSRSIVLGMDKTVIKSLPFFRFSSLKGWREGLECAVCWSKFEDIAILRLLPKCRHAFHVDCVDRWLEHNSACPLCRQNVSVDDLSPSTYSNSLRFLWNNEDSNIELHVEREQNFHGSSKLSASSFRKSGKETEEELPNRENLDSDNQNKKVHHKFNHKITVLDVMLKNRWSNVSSSDLIFLNSEMLNDIPSRICWSLDSRYHDQKSMETRNMVEENGLTINITKEMEKNDRVFEGKIEQTDYLFPLPSFSTTLDESKQNSGFGPKISNSDKRSMSEITVHRRFNNGDSYCVQQNNVKEKRMRRLWLHIASKTVLWFANKEKRASESQPTIPGDRLNV